MTSAIPILMYHNVDIAPRHSTRRNFYVAPNAFKQQMWWLRRLGFEGRSVRDALPELSGTSSDKVAVITFDDGFAGVYENALPILKEFGFTATCYFVSRCFGTYNIWDRDSLTEPKPIMSVAQAAQWGQAGMEIGSHTCNHPHLTSCTPEICTNEIAISKFELEQKFGTEVISFSYPAGDYNDLIASSVQLAGYRSAVTTRRGRVRPGGDPFRLRRVDVNGRRSGRRSVVPFVAGIMTNIHNLLDQRLD